MPNKSADEAREMSEEQLAQAVDQAYRELFNLRFRHANHNLENANELKNVRRKIARLRTIQRESQIVAVEGR